MAEVEINCEDDRWLELDITGLTARAADATLAELGLGAAFAISLLACDDARIETLNGDFRGKPAPTNVLSWPVVELAAKADGGAPARPDPSRETELGDIAIAYETCAREAGEQGKTMADHVTHLLVHGILHLLGYDHIRDRDAALMEGIERAVLAKMGVADPY